MSSNEKIGENRRSRPVKSVGTVAICIALAAVAYGIAGTAAHVPQAPVGFAATAAVPAAERSLPAVAQDAALPVAAAGLDRVPGPRECAIDKFIDSACTYP